MGSKLTSQSISIYGPLQSHTVKLFAYQILKEIFFQNVVVGE